jgi:hypothetical protein
LRIRLSIPDRHVSPEVLESVLEATARANSAAMAAGEVPSLSDSLRAGLKWKPEPFTDGEHFDLASVAAKRGWADCDDLSPWLVSEMRAAGEPARSRVYRSGPGKFHVVVQDSTGKIHDPSRWAGMKGQAPAGISGALARPMLPGAVCGMVVVPHAGRWHARVDVPWPGHRSAHVASTARSRTVDGALERAMAGAIGVGQAIGADVDDLAVIGEALLRPSDEDEVGIFGSLGKMASSLVPGGSMIYDAATGLMKKGGKGKGGGAAPVAPGGAGTEPSWVMYQPTGAPGPTVVRMR